MGFPTLEEKREKEKQLIESILMHKEEVQQLLDKAYHQFGGKEDMVYRFYHHSFKVYKVQQWTSDAFLLFRKFSSEEMNDFFLRIVREGTSKPFSMEHNDNWYEEAKPLLDAYLHMIHLMELVVKYGIEGTDKDRSGDPGWFTILYLYRLR